MDQHRVALEFRSGIWVLFLETLIQKGIYSQQLVRIFGHRYSIRTRYDAAEKAGLFMIADRKIEKPLIVRDAALKDVVIRSSMEEQLYTYCWGNNDKRESMRGRTCRVLSRGEKNSCAVEFTDNGQKEIISRNALRKVAKGGA